MLLSKESSSGRAEASCHVCPVSIHWLCRLGKWAAASDAAPARLLSEQCCIPKAAVFFPPCAYLAHFLAVASYHAAHKAKPIFAEQHVIGLPSSGSGKAGVKPAQFAALLAQVCRGAIKNGWSGERAAPWCTKLTRPCRIPRWVPFFLFIYFTSFLMADINSYGKDWPICYYFFSCWVIAQLNSHLCGLLPGALSRSCAFLLASCVCCSCAGSKQNSIRWSHAVTPWLRRVRHVLTAGFTPCSVSCYSYHNASIEKLLIFLHSSSVRMLTLDLGAEGTRKNLVCFFLHSTAGICLGSFNTFCVFNPLRNEFGKWFPFCCLNIFELSVPVYVVHSLDVFKIRLMLG